MAEHKNTAAAQWSEAQLREHWDAALADIAAETKFPLVRLRYQAEQTSEVKEAFANWGDMAADERSAAWEELGGVASRATHEIFPVCVECGECCVKGGPALHLDDLALVQAQAIPWSSLRALRVGERARSPLTGALFDLEHEQIMVRPHPDRASCSQYQEGEQACAIYPNRPIQCRAQACWDSEMSEEVAKTPHLTRRDLFAELEPLLEVIEQHEQRCSFADLRAACEAVAGAGDGAGKALDELLERVAFEDHFRHFVADKFKIPDDQLELVFGRAFVDLVELFGFKVETGEDGTRVLRPTAAVP